jgi:hypothetical protein
VLVLCVVVAVVLDVVDAALAVTVVAFQIVAADVCLS